jgi:hypothetical protein
MFLFPIIGIPVFFLLTAILPSALVLHLSSTLSKKFPDSWQNIKTRFYCLTALLLIYVYAYLFSLMLCVLGGIPVGLPDPLQYGYITKMFKLLIFPYYPLTFIYRVLFHGEINFVLKIIVCLSLLLAIRVAFIATRGMKNKFKRIISTSLLAILILVVSSYPLIVFAT